LKEGKGINTNKANAVNEKVGDNGKGAALGFKSTSEHGGGKSKGRQGGGKEGEKNKKKQFSIRYKKENKRFIKRTSLQKKLNK